MRSTDRGAAGEVALAGTAGQTTSSASVDDHGAVSKQAGAKARWAREKGEKVNVGDSATFTRNLSVSAAAVVGMGRQRYEQAKEVVEAGEQSAPDLAEFFGALDIGLGQLHDAADALRHVGQSIAEGCSTPDECIGDLNEIAALIFTGCSSTLDAVSLRLMVHEAAR